MTNSFYMHPKDQDFLGSIKNLAFDVWLLGGNVSESKEQWLIAENARLTKENEQLVRDMHRIDSARQAAISQCAALVAQIEVLTDAINEVRP